MSEMMQPKQIAEETLDLFLEFRERNGLDVARARALAVSEIAEGTASESYPEAKDDGLLHKSDCARHNAPAMQPGPCSCGSVEWLRMAAAEARDQLLYIASETHDSRARLDLERVIDMLKGGLAYQTFGR